MFRCKDAADESTLKEKKEKKEKKAEKDKMKK